MAAAEAVPVWNHTTPGTPAGCVEEKMCPTIGSVVFTQIVLLAGVEG
jgi:hypothetical protein